MKTSHNCTAESRYGWRWSLIALAGLAWLSIGCSPASMFMLGGLFDDGKKEPEYKLFNKEKEITLVVTSNFFSQQIQPEIIPTDSELAESVSQHLRQRCAENKHTLKLVPQAQVRSYQLRQKQEGDYSQVELGKHFKADYVLDMTINGFGLYQKDTFPKMYRGTAQIRVNLFKTKVKDEEDHVVWGKDYTCDYAGPRGAITEVGSSDPAPFRRMFLTRIGREVSRMFVPYSPDESKQMD